MVHVFFFLLTKKEEGRAIKVVETSLPLPPSLFHLKMEHFSITYLKAPLCPRCYFMQLATLEDRKRNSLNCYLGGFKQKYNYFTSKMDD